ncbi:MAG: hypothetical protein HY909_14935 [Deltaproteobacteria bacterium]|nr:hypothetical protein [Deltaproteobacteria bacterium]
MNNIDQAPRDTVKAALASASWAHCLPTAASGYALAWRDALLPEDAPWDALPHALGVASARSVEPYEGAHEVWSVACAALLLRDAQRPLAGSPDAQGALLRDAEGALRGAVVETLAPRAPTLDRACRGARKALLTHRRGTASLGYGFELALCDRLSDALSALARPDASVPRELLAAVDKADLAARKNHERDWLFAAPALRRARARAAVTEVTSAWALAATALPADGAASALWLARVTLGLLASVTALDGWAAGEAPAAAVIHAANAPNTVNPLNALNALNALNPGTVKAPGAALAAAGEETTMTDTTPRTWTRTLQVDATDAAWRTAGSQFVKLARDPLAGLLCRHLGPEDPSLRARVAAFLETELGTSLLAAVLAAGLGALPTDSTGEVPQRLARELRVRAMAGTADVVADVLMGPLREVMATFLRDGGALQAQPVTGHLEGPSGHLTVSHLTTSAREPSER